MAKPFKKTKKLPKYFGGGSAQQQGQGSSIYSTSGMYGQMAGTAAQGLTNQENMQYTDSGNQQGASLEASAGQALPWMKFATSMRDMGQSQLPRDEYGNITGGGNKAANEWMTADHTHMMNAAKEGDALGVVRESAGMGKIGRSISQIAGRDQETSGTWGKFNKLVGVKKDKEFRQGGPSYPTNAIPIHGGNWAIPTFGQGGTFQVDGPSHEQGGVEIQSPNGNYEVEKEEAIQPTPSGDFILSDDNKLKLPSTGKNPAQSYKPYQNKLDKLDKLAEQGKLDKYSTKALELTQKAADKTFDKLYKEQEEMKAKEELVAQMKYKKQLENNYAKCGGMIKYKDGGIHINPENRGKFTAAAKHAGMGVQEYANHILVNKEDFSSTLVKRANFAHNAASFKHADGGYQPLDNPYKHLKFIPQYPDGGQNPVTPIKPTNATLMNNVNLNQDPSQLPEGVPYSAYNQFQKYLSSKDFVKDPRMNTNEGRKQYTDQLINEYNNTSQHVKNFPNHKITPDYIRAVQEYHKKADPNVVVDGWVGSQTSQMKFPVPVTKVGPVDANGNPLNTTNPYDVTWGNKKYTLPVDKYNNGKYTTKDFVPVHRNGGMQKFEDGGTDNPIGYQPRTLAEQYKMQQATNNLSMYDKQLADKQAAIDAKNLAYKSPWDNPDNFQNTENTQSTQNQSGTNWKDVGYNTGMFLANSAGPLSYLAEQGKKYDKQNFYNYNPETLDPTASIRDIDTYNRNAAESLKNATAGNAGTYLSNRIALAASGAINKDKTRREYSNINAQIKNQGQQYNIGNKYMTDDINARNKGAALSNYYKAIGQVGTNAAVAGRDYKGDQMDQKQLNMMNDFFQNYTFDKKTNSWKFKK